MCSTATPYQNMLGSWQPTNEKPHLSFEKRRLVFNQWLPFSSSIFAASTLRIYPSFNAGVFGRIEPSAVYTRTSFFISPTLFLERIHSNHPNLSRVYAMRPFIQNIQCNCGDNRLRADEEEEFYNNLIGFRLRSDVEVRIYTV